MVFSQKFTDEKRGLEGQTLGEVVPCHEAIKDFVKTTEFFSIKDVGVVKKNAEQTMLIMSSTLATGMLLRVFEEPAGDRLQRRKVCQQLLKKREREGLAIRAPILEMARQAVTQALR